MGGVWGYFWEVFGGVLEAFLWYFGRFLGGKNKEENRRKRRINKINYFFNLVIFLISL